MYKGHILPVNLPVLQYLADDTFANPAETGDNVDVCRRENVIGFKFHIIWLVGTNGIFGVVIHSFLYGILIREQFISYLS